MTLRNFLTTYKKPIQSVFILISCISFTVITVNHVNQMNNEHDAWMRENALTADQQMTYCRSKFIKYHIPVSDITIEIVCAPIVLKICEENKYGCRK